MEFSLIDGTLAELECDALIVGKYRGDMTLSAKDLCLASGGVLEKWFESGDASGCQGEAAIFRRVPGVKAERVVVVGLGKEKDGAQNFELAVKTALKAVYFAKKIVIVSDDWLGVDPVWAVEKTARFMVESFEKSEDWKSSHKVQWKQPDSIAVYVPEKTTEFEKAFSYGIALGKSMMMAKDLGNMPPNLCTPKFMAEKCISIGTQLNIDVTVFDEEALKKLKMGCLLGVSQGSAQPPRMVVMEYNGGEKDNPPICLIGKGLTFDSGGISLKPAKSMDEMKYDMSGAAAVVASIAAASALKMPLNIVAIIGCTENLPGGNAIKPGDILTSYSGKTVEVLNTDAEGRLVLCDLISYAIDKFKPATVIDTATLTGACMVALGKEYAGLFSNDEDLAYALLQCGQNSLDRCWRLPLCRNYAEALKTNFADIANIGGPFAGASTAAAFLKFFVGDDTSWAHLDIAGTAWNSEGKTKGSTGRPVPILVDYLRTRTA
ncbi:MAG: leucyl aminopeptidase [Burkholderiales bacterium]|nr:leucyl aminopeptidase [Burkholderiales bacterium]